jgi:hypothetical protein
VITVYASERQHAKLGASLPPSEPTMVVEDWMEFERAASSSSCSVVSIDWLHTSPAVPRLAAFKNRHPRHPVVLVTRWDADNARHLIDVPVEEVVWSGEVDRELLAALRRVCRSDPNPVHYLTLALEEAKHLPATLRTALPHACRSRRPIHSVNQLAVAAGCDRRTLWNQWNQVVGASSELRLQDFLHWLLLLRAAGRKCRSDLGRA